MSLYLNLIPCPGTGRDGIIGTTGTGSGGGATTGTVDTAVEEGGVGTFGTERI